MGLYLAPIISNETSAAFLTALGIYAVLVAAGSQRWDTAAIAGGAAGLAMLGKFSAVFILTVGLGVLALRIRPRAPRTWKAPIAYGVAAAAVCGWFCARNVASYGNPFVGNRDDASSFAPRQIQEPSFRTVDFFYRFGAVFFQHPTRSLWTSWLDGMYATMWADSHAVLIDPANDRAFLWMSVLIIVGFLPVAVMALGFARTSASAVWGEPGADANAVMIFVSWWTWVALIWFALRIPGYSTVKAFYFLSLAPTLGVFLARGRRLLYDGLHPAGWLLDWTLVVMAILVLHIYRLP
jgi:hypothetical protein